MTGHHGVAWCVEFAGVGGVSRWTGAAAPLHCGGVGTARGGACARPSLTACSLLSASQAQGTLASHGVSRSEAGGQGPER